MLFQNSDTNRNSNFSQEGYALHSLNQSTAKTLWDKIFFDGLRDITQLQFLVLSEDGTTTELLTSGWP